GTRNEPWLPQPADWAFYAVDRQSGDPGSMLTLYRQALRLRRTEPGFGDGPMTWLATGEDVLAFRRDHDLVCVVNLSETPATLPPHERLLLASGPLHADGTLPKDTTVWLRA
uniref:DUF3459 domain-containing protein n=1 Tax=Streptomyces prasinopilosus TaxID=67344 RepID=UPI0012FEB21F